MYLPVLKRVLCRSLAEQKAEVPALEVGHIEHILEIVFLHDNELRRNTIRLNMKFLALNSTVYRLCDELEVLGELKNPKFLETNGDIF